MAKIKVGDYVDVVTRSFDRFKCIVVKYYPERRAFYGRIIHNGYPCSVKTAKWDRYSIPDNAGQFVLLDDLYSIQIINTCSVTNVTKAAISRNTVYDENDGIHDYGCGGASSEYIPEERITYRRVKIGEDDTVVFCTVFDATGSEYGGWGRCRSVSTQTFADNTAYDQARESMHRMTTPRGFKL